MLAMLDTYKLKRHGRRVLGTLLPERRRRTPAAPVYLFCYHKVATVLLSKVFREVGLDNGWRFQALKGQQDTAPDTSGIALFSHSLSTHTLKQPFAGVHVIRDPRDVIVSGYLYHRRTAEAWCVNKDFSAASPTSSIMFPQVPYSQEHRPEAWKQAYLDALGGRSYQEHLLSLSPEEGLLFEMNYYGAWTIESMLAWNYAQEGMLELKFEHLMRDYDATFHKIFTHIGLSGAQLRAAMRTAANHDLSKKSDHEIRAIKHVSSKKPGKWQHCFTDAHRQRFHELFGDALVRLGYETGDNW